MIQHIKKLLGILLFATIITFCAGVKKVAFETPVDITVKLVTDQTKYTFKPNGLTIFASNEFDGARTSDFEKQNDGTVIVVVNPENTPLNNSGYYDFKAWSDSNKSVYFTFQYPKGYEHRYLPKLKVNVKWQLIDSTNIFKKDSIATMKLDLSKRPITVAAQVIQSSKDVTDWFTYPIDGKESQVHLERVGRSKLRRNLPV